MPRIACSLALSLVFLGLLGVLDADTRPQALAEEETSPGQDMVWEGYLFRDADGRVRLGWPVVSMGVMAMPAHIVEGRVADRLGPLLTDVQDDYVFWNYDLEERADGALRGIPRVLVRLRGRVTLERPNDENYGSYQGGARTMHDARLVGVEFLSETWLRQWGRIFRDRDSPFRIDLDRGTITDEERKAFAGRLLPVLVSMREIPASGEAERTLATGIDPSARVVDTHRKQTEWSLQRWLVGMKAKHADLTLAGLEALPSLPPSSLDLQHLFLASEKKAAFLESVRKQWRGSLEALELPCYEVRGRSTVWTTVDLGTIDRAWSEEEYESRRATTQRMAAR